MRRCPADPRRVRGSRRSRRRAEEEQSVFARRDRDAAVGQHAHVAHAFVREPRRGFGSERRGDTIDERPQAAVAYPATMRPFAPATASRRSPASPRARDLRARGRSSPSAPQSGSRRRSCCSTAESSRRCVAREDARCAAVPFDRKRSAAKTKARPAVQMPRTSPSRARAAGLIDGRVIRERAVEISGSPTPPAAMTPALSWRSRTPRSRSAV
jgi:hypothetical protein